ncbi:MAG: hypothetical protein JWR47_2654 [Phenylobacterium sp.]|uniref:hypothetical protein n=1 Tax=Phenylobacterium sp. TaxID=1871053 RepID=UPI00261F9D12|nr:hypothetical protein [Phenylobacterium sp.]MDB5428797.1 hypothetical protein [Phenylobacterium sp.]MDB5436397.1 hypothetical protein [Phenylobacterium sp.]MDB5498940.1 hypothetical protein [Phenylobacterium sp.]
MKLKTIGLALVATGFMASTALAQTGTMQPIPNPPEKAKPMHKAKKKHAAKPAAAADAKAPAAEAKAPAAAAPVKK